MCGIYGIYQVDGAPADALALPRMGAQLIHRGPDDEGAHVAGRCALGMRRLSIIDVAGGHQPISDADDRHVVVCNGEIYNFRTLRAELERNGVRFRSRSDTEVLLHGHAVWGHRVFERLNGMYAFALWDASTQSLVVGRDRLGIKPLYYAYDGRRFAFASEAKALLQLPGVDDALDPQALDAYLRLGYVPAPLTMWRGIRKLPIATIARLTPAGMTQQTLWRVPTSVDHTVDDGEWAVRVREQLERSVERQMVSDVPIGAFLSGGIDSSAVVALMSRSAREPVRTYSIGFAGGAAERFYNELAPARRVAQLFATDHHEIVVRPDVAALLPRLLWQMDEPIADSAFVTTYLVAEFARRDVKVILSGVGGDELFGGYRRYLGERYLGTYGRLPHFVRRGAESLVQRLPVARHRRWLNELRLMRQFVVSAGQPPAQRYASYVGAFTDDETDGLLTQVAGARFDPIGAAFADIGGDDPLARMFAVDAATQLPDDLLLLTDKMTMAASVECRVPLLDHELVELAARIPARIKLRGGQLKSLLKRALADLLPPDILHRPKRGFGAPMGAWMQGALAPLLSNALSAAAIERRGVLRAQPVQRLIAAHRANRIDGTDRLLALLAFEIWCRLYLDRRSVEDIGGELTELTPLAA
jgi:asparagine synthase (glutamine-hydrolysing)